MSYNSQVPNLPFRYDAAMAPRLQYRSDSPPCVPSIPGCPPQLQYLLPVICAMVANEAVIKSNAHAGRMYLFNQLAVNNFANNDYASAVSTVIDILLLQMRKGAIRNAEDGLNQAVSDTLSILTALLFQNQPALQSVTPADIVYEASNIISSFHNLNNEIASMKMQNQPMMNQNVGMQQPQMMINPSFGMGNINQPAFQNTFSNNQNIRPINNQPGNTPIFNQNRAPTGNLQFSNNEQSASKYAHLIRKEPPVEVVRVSTPMNINLVNQNMDTNPELKISDWMPSISQAYPPTFNPFKSKLVIKEITKNGSNNKILKTVPLEDSEMDRSKHVITSMSQVYTARIPEAYGTREQSLEENVNKIFQIDHDALTSFNTDESKEEPESLELLSYINPTWVIDSFIEPSIFSGKFQHKDHCKRDTDCSIYRVYRIIANPIICEEDHSAFINELSACKSFRELSAILRETINDNLTSKSLIDLCYGIEKMLTTEVNNIIRNKMSIPNTTIESFIDDVNDLPSHLMDNYGSMYERVFLDFQKPYISQIVSSLRSADTESISCCLIEDSTNPLVKINFISHSYSITYLTVENDELGIQPYDDCASSVLEFEHPLMYKIVTGIFNQDRDIDHECLHNLIITSDDVIYEVQKGLIGTDIFTINLWKK